MRAAIKIASTKQLIVEGNDDIRVFNAIAEDLGISDLQVHGYGGYPKLRTFLRTFKALPEFRTVRTLAVVADANCSRVDRERGIRDALSNSDLPMPSAPLEVASNGNLSVMYLVVPHNRDTGMIEDVCLDSVSTDPAIDCVDGYFDCIRETSLPGPIESRVSKARVHAFLASRERPELRLGEAADSGIWPLDADAFSPMRELLRKL